MTFQKIAKVGFDLRLQLLELTVAKTIKTAVTNMIEGIATTVIVASVIDSEATVLMVAIVAVATVKTVTLMIMTIALSSSRLKGIRR